MTTRKYKSYILIALSVRDVTIMLSVLHFLWQNRPLYINCRKVQFRMHPWRYLNARKEWTEFSRQVSADHLTQRKVLHFLYITAPGWLTVGKCSSECIHEGILMRGKNERNLEASFRRPLDTEKSDGPSTGRRP
jgi:hypothetical protein